MGYSDSIGLLMYIYQVKRESNSLTRILGE